MAAVTRSQLAADLRALGLRPGGILMVHTRMSALGWVVGAAETVVLALRDALGPDGTLVAYASWEEHVYRRRSGRPSTSPPTRPSRPPSISPCPRPCATTAASRALRTWPGARRATMPRRASRRSAPAPRAHRDHPQGDGYGPDSPFARVVAADGQVLLLGAPLETITCCTTPRRSRTAPGKRTVRLSPSGRRGAAERSYTDIETTPARTLQGARRCRRADPFEVDRPRGLAAGAGRAGRIAAAECHLFDAAP